MMNVVMLDCGHFERSFVVWSHSWNHFYVLTKRTFTSQHWILTFSVSAPHGPLPLPAWAEQQRRNKISARRLIHHGKMQKSSESFCWKLNLSSSEPHAALIWFSLERIHTLTASRYTHFLHVNVLNSCAFELFFVDHPWIPLKHIFARWIFLKPDLFLKIEAVAVSKRQK